MIDFIKGININKLTKRELEVINFIINNQSTINKMGDIIEKLNIGYSTIYSIISKSSFSSFNELLLEVKYIVKKENDSMKKYLYKSNSIFQDNLINLEGNLTILSQQDKKIKKLVNIIKKADKIVVAGSGTSGYEADKLCDILLKNNINALPATGMLSRSYMILENLRENDILVCLSISAKTPFIRKALMKAKHKGVHTVLITTEKNPLIQTELLINIFLYNQGSYKNNTYPLSLFSQFLLQKLLKNS